ncbi:MAG TPA: transaldolase [Dermatophilaceae bacterium]|nr:transaldolase [Dermatophilaceae bacterium]
MIQHRLAALADQGVSIWLDDVNRGLVVGGGLAELVRGWSVSGVTTNPTIFASALRDEWGYRDQLADLAAAGASVEAAVEAITTEDVQRACDVLRPVHDATGGRDGLVSLEVDPTLSHDADATLAAALRLRGLVGRPNVMIKIPATREGLPAVTSALAHGVSVNVTLIFALDRYREVMNAFLDGIEQARQSGLPLNRIQSVASFFVSRVDTEVDRRLQAIGSPEALRLRGLAAVANARLAYHSFEEVFRTPRWATLADDGAQPQRPLWASTGVKNPAYPDTRYIVDLVAPNTVSTMPRATLEAVADHGEVTGDQMRAFAEQARTELDELAAVGISYGDVVATLEQAGLDAFEASWASLSASVRDGLTRAGGPAR